VVQYIHARRIADIAVDSIGLGNAVCSRLAEQLVGLHRICAHEHRVVPFNASHRAFDAAKYANKKTELLLGLMRLMQDRSVGLPAREGDQVQHLERLTRELSGMKLLETFRGASRVEDPATSPDLADSLLVALSLREGLASKGGARMLPLIEAGF
jgi:hypothetical protein